MSAQSVVSVDIEGGVSVPERVLTRQRPAGSWWWKACGALLAVALCAAAAVVLISQGKIQSIPVEGDLHHSLRQLSKHAKAAIHLAGDSNDDHTDIEWRLTDHSFSQDGLKLVDNEIHIPRTGLYFVYSQASFGVKCKADEVTYLGHSVMRSSDMYGNVFKVLFRSDRSVCERTFSDETGSETRYNAVYLGAVFKLEKGDKLRTHTEPLISVDGEGGKTFFGVFAI